MPSRPIWRRCAGPSGSSQAAVRRARGGARLPVRYTHRVALSNRRLIAADSHGVKFTYKDYRREGRDRYRTMTLSPHEFIRRFLIHVLPKGFHRIRHYGLFASAERRHNIAQLQQWLAVPAPKPEVDDVSRTRPPPQSRSPRPARAAAAAW